MGVSSLGSTRLPNEYGENCGLKRSRSDLDYGRFCSIRIAVKVKRTLSWDEPWMLNRQEFPHVVSSIRPGYGLCNRFARESRRRFEITVAKGLLLPRPLAENGSHFGLQPSCRGRAPWPQ